MMKLKIESTFNITAHAEIDLPAPYTWGDVTSWGVKWDTFSCVFGDDTEWSCPLNSELNLDAVEMKKPKGLRVEDENEKEVYCG